jgi:hypothetical protein
MHQKTGALDLFREKHSGISCNAVHNQPGSILDQPLGMRLQGRSMPLSGPNDFLGLSAGPGTGVPEPFRSQVMGAGSGIGQNLPGFIMGSGKHSFRLCAGFLNLLLRPLLSFSNFVQGISHGWLAPGLFAKT